MSYTDFIANFSPAPDHHWTFDNTNDDEIGTANTTVESLGTFDAPPITTNGERTQSLRFDASGERQECADQADMNTASDTQRRTVMGWFMIENEVPATPICVWKEGGGQANIACFIGYGGQINGQIIENAPLWSVAGYGKNASPDRPYHWALTFSGNNFDDRVIVLIDGEPVTSYVPPSAAPGQPSLLGHSGDINWGDPDTGLNIGGTGVSFNGLNTNTAAVTVQDWVSWFDVELSVAQVRELFEAGARPFAVITSDTEANMQVQADALGVLPNYPLCLEVAAPSGSNDLYLTLDAVTFDDLASLHIRWMGTGTLTLNLPNGSNPDLVNKLHTPNGGTVVEDLSFDLTITDLAPGNEVRIYEYPDASNPAFGTELAGVEDVAGTSFVFTHQLAGTQILLQIIGTSEGYEERNLVFTLATNDQQIPAGLIIEENT